MPPAISRAAPTNGLAARISDERTARECRLNWISAATALNAHHERRYPPAKKITGVYGLPRFDRVAAIRE